MKQEDLTVIVPLYNEEEFLSSLMAELVPYCNNYGWRLILVDDGSTDETGTILQKYAEYEGVQIISHKLNRGYGAAIKSGIRAADTTYAVTIDGDGQHYLSDINKLMKFAIETDADLVVGNRGSDTSNAYRMMGKHIIRFVAKLLMDVPIQDLNSGLKLHRTQLAKKYINVCPDSMAFSEFITLVYINYRDLVLEFPVRIRERQGGKSTINILNAFEAVAEIINLIVLFKPLRVFLFLSFGAIIVGFVWGVRFVLQGRGVSVGSMLAIVIGVLLFSLGLLAKQLSTIYLSMISQEQK